MPAILVLIFWFFYWVYVFNMKNPLKQLVLLAIGLVAPGGAEVLACFIACYLVYKVFSGSSKKPAGTV